MSTTSTRCKICGAASEVLTKATVLNKHSVTYFACPRCEFIQTEEPFWLAESYASAINSSDVGYVRRNLDLSRVTFSMAVALFRTATKFLDYGAGYGLFVRLMRDKGLDWYWQDEYCRNLFAQGAELGDCAERRFDLLSSFEVFEHLVEPMKEIEKMLTFAPAIVFSTLLLPRPGILPSEWWYYSLHHGQHIALYSRKTLEVIAKEFGLFLSTKGSSFHVLSRTKISYPLFRIFTNRKVAALVNLLSQRASLSDQDRERIVADLGKHV